MTMPSETASRPGAADPPAALARRLGYLLKHAQQLLAEMAAPALAPMGIDGRELAALALLADEYPLAQQQAALRLGIDRTTMVALTDALEGKGLAERSPDPADRRRNIVGVTAAGREVLGQGTAARDAAERQFLAPLGSADGERLMAALQALIRAHAPSRLAGRAGSVA